MSDVRTRPATAEEIEGALQRDNPKGRLWERCAQLRIAHPRVRHRATRERHQVEMSLDVGEWELSSGVHAGGSRKHVEQLAARALLVELEQLLVEEPAAVAQAAAPTGPSLGDEDVWEVGAEDAERLRRENPKGQVFEWCQKRRPPVARPRFESRKAKGGGVHVRATLVTLHLSSPWFRASQVKMAEQAAAEALLPLLPDGAEEGGADPRSMLNELRQRGVIADYAFDITAEEGAAPAHRFTVIGRLSIADGRVESTAPIHAGSKREAALLAARALLERLPSGRSRP